MDKRSEKRTKVDGTIKCRHGASAWQEHLRDLSVGGCKLDIHGAPLAEGARVDLTLLSGISVLGTVRWAHEGEIGIQFDEAINKATVRYFTLDLEGVRPNDPTYDSFGRALPPLSKISID